MRNLISLSTQVYPIKQPQSSSIQALTIDVQSNVILSATAQPPDNGLISFTILAHSSHAAAATVISRFSAPASPNQRDGIVSLQYLADGGNGTSAVVLVTAGGDIAFVELPPDGLLDETQVPEIVGSVEQGVLAAAWSPDEEELVIVTAASLEDEAVKVLVMNKEWQVLSEAHLETQQVGTEQFVNLGWGSVETQFHGKAGKAAAAAAAQAIQASSMDATAPSQAVQPDDDALPRISWRSDSSLFAISSLAQLKGRSVRIFARDGQLSATSEPLKGLGHTLAWQPNTILVALNQRFVTSESDGAVGRQGRHDVIFMERNGLRHGEFSLREEGGSQPSPGTFDTPQSSLHAAASWHSQHDLRELAWNADGSLLAVWLRRNNGASVVQLWSPTNYTWCLRSELQANDVEALRWHPEEPLCLYTAQSSGIQAYTWTFNEVVSTGVSPHDAACVAVLDGCSVRLTPLRTHNVPPPYAAQTLCIPGQSPAVQHVAWADASSVSLSQSILAVLLAPHRVLLYRLEWGELGPRAPRGGWKAPNPQLIAEFQLADDDFTARQVAVAAIGSENDEQLEYIVCALGSCHFSSDEELRSARITRQDSVTQLPAQPLSGRTLRTFVTVQEGNRHLGVVLHEADGSMRRVSAPLDETEQQLPALTQFCPRVVALTAAAVAANDDDDAVQHVFIGLTSSGQVISSTRRHVLARDATSLALSDTMIIWTSTAHEARFQPIASVLAPQGEEEEASQPVALSRRVERGSCIVAVVPSSMSLVLQMPRGNLETIFPRPLVLEVVHKCIAVQQYGRAFQICRTHRIDLNSLCDDDLDTFLAHLSTFIEQVPEQDHLNLFLSSLKREGKDDAAKTNRVCDALRQQLESIDPTRTRYLNTILTTHVRKQPPHYEAALQLLRDVKTTDEHAADEACKYVIFLADADKLFDAALGLYDFVLPLLVAQHSPRKDPREYLPFLRELRAVQPIELQRFRIDDHLGRHGRALGWLVRAGGEENKAEALRYMEHHELYAHGIAAWSHDRETLRQVHGLYADWLLHQKRPKEAAVAFTLAARPKRAVDAYRQSGQWREAFALALSPPRYSAADLVSLAQDFTTLLEDSARYSEAALVALEYGRDVDQAVTLLDQARDFSESVRVCALHSRMDLVETHVKPALLEAQTQVLEDVHEISTQLERTLERLAELRVKKAERPDDFYPDDGNDGADDGRSDTLSRISSFTRFTRFTQLTGVTGATGVTGVSAISGTTARSAMRSKLRKKEERKRATGKKGSIYEEDYLFVSLRKLLGERLQGVQVSTSALLPHLALLSTTHRKAGVALTHALTALEARAAEAVAELTEAVATEYAAIEQLRLEALRSAEGASFAELMAAGLFNPQISREPVLVAASPWQFELAQVLAGATE